MGKRILAFMIIALAAAGCSALEFGQSGGSPEPGQPTVNTSSPSPAIHSPTSVSPAPTTTMTPAPTSPGSSPKLTPSAPPATETGTLSSAQAVKEISDRTAQVIAAIKSKDLAKLKAYVHPDKGVRISLYGHVNKQKDLVFKGDQLEKLSGDKTSYTWGNYDGSGEPIKLTFNEFYEKFLYNHDYAKPEKTVYNQFLGTGNTVNNLRESYPGSITVEYYYSGFDPKLQGHDWASLILIYEKKGDAWYLVGIARNQWTI